MAAWPRGVWALGASDALLSLVPGGLAVPVGRDLLVDPDFPVFPECPADLLHLQILRTCGRRVPCSAPKPDPDAPKSFGEQVGWCSTLESSKSQIGTVILGLEWEMKGCRDSCCCCAMSFQGRALSGVPNFFLYVWHLGQDVPSHHVHPPPDLSNC